MITIKNQQEIQIMREGGKILAKIMAELSKIVKPGITTEYLDKVAQDLVFKYGAEPSFKGYQNFPAVLCVSINEEIVHGVPSSERNLKEGDIVSLDLGILYQGFHTDMAVTLPVGQVIPEALRLIRVTKKALKRALKKIRPGNTVGDIGNTIERYVKSQGLKVIRDLCGHGIGRELHEEPQILNYGKRKKGTVLKPGMTLCIEPMVSLGSEEIEKAKDGFAYKTKDNSLSAHFEHTVLVTENGNEILTSL